MALLAMAGVSEDIVRLGLHPLTGISEASNINEGMTPGSGITNIEGTQTLDIVVVLDNGHDPVYR